MKVFMPKSERLILPVAENPAACFRDCHSTAVVTSISNGDEAHGGKINRNKGTLPDCVGRAINQALA
jgi:hypothetical protein